MITGKDFHFFFSLWCLFPPPILPPARRTLLGSPVSSAASVGHVEAHYAAHQNNLKKSHLERTSEHSAPISVEFKGGSFSFEALLVSRPEMSIGTPSSRCLMPHLTGVRIPTGRYPWPLQRKS